MLDLNYSLFSPPKKMVTYSRYREHSATWFALTSPLQQSLLRSSKSPGRDGVLPAKHHVCRKLSYRWHEITSGKTLYAYSRNLRPSTVLDDLAVYRSSTFVITKATKTAGIRITKATTSARIIVSKTTTSGGTFVAKSAKAKSTSAT